jgi:chromosome segregation ATPase
LSEKDELRKQIEDLRKLCDEYKKSTLKLETENEDLRIVVQECNNEIDDWSRMYKHRGRLLEALRDELDELKVGSEDKKTK